MGSRLLPKMTVRAQLCKVLHIFEIAAGQSLHVRKGATQIDGETVDDLGPPAFLGLTRKNVAAEFVIKLNLLGIGRQHDALPGSDNATFEVGQPLCIVCGKRG